MDSDILVLVLVSVDSKEGSFQARERIILLATSILEGGGGGGGIN